MLPVRRLPPRQRSGGNADVLQHLRASDDGSFGPTPEAARRPRREHEPSSPTISMVVTVRSSRYRGPKNVGLVIHGAARESGGPRDDVLKSRRVGIDRRSHRRTLAHASHAARGRREDVESEVKVFAPKASRHREIVAQACEAERFE